MRVGSVVPWPLRPTVASRLRQASTAPPKSIAKYEEYLNEFLKNQKLLRREEVASCMGALVGRIESLQALARIESLQAGAARAPGRGGARTGDYHGGPTGPGGAGGGATTAGATTAAIRGGRVSSMLDPSNLGTRNS